MRLKNIVTAAAFIAAAAGGGIWTAWSDVTPAGVMVMADGVKMVHNQKGEWVVYRPGHMTSNMDGSVTEEYAFEKMTTPVVLPGTSGQCEGFIDCMLGR